MAIREKDPGPPAGRTLRTHADLSPCPLARRRPHRTRLREDPADGRRGGREQRGECHPGGLVCPGDGERSGFFGPAAGAVGAGSGGTTLAGRLAQEARSRPPIHPNADEILAAFAKAGGVVPTKNQGLGSTYNAKFCEGGTTEDGLVTISICEYADADSAKAGLQALQEIFPAKAATHVLRKDTVLTTLKLKDGPAAQALESKLLAAYKGL